MHRPCTRTDVALFYIAFIKAWQINLLHLEGGEYCHDLMRFEVSAEALLAEGHGINRNCLDELGAYISYVLTFSRVLSIFLEWAIPAATRASNTWIEGRSLRAALRRVIESVASSSADRADALKTLRTSAPWAVSYAQRMFSLSGKSEAEFNPLLARELGLPKMSFYEEQVKARQPPPIASPAVSPTQPTPSCLWALTRGAHHPPRIRGVRLILSGGVHMQLMSGAPHPSLPANAS